MGVYIELQELSNSEISGKARIRMSALKIHDNDYETQDNGINWKKEYVLNQLESAKHMHYVVSWFDEEAQIPCSHGEQDFNEYGELTFSNSVVVGDVREAYVDTIYVDGKPVTVLMTEGFINTQRYNKLYHWLKESVARGTVYGSVEFRGKHGRQIIYDGKSHDESGKLCKGRRPREFDFSDLAIMHLTTPADKASQVVEINNKLENKEEEQRMNEDLVKLMADNEKKNQTINELNAKIKSIEDEKGKSLSDQAAELNKKNGELEEKVKTLEADKQKLEGEITELKKKLEETEAEKKKAEVNAYFKESIEDPKNGFEVVEINQLKAFADKGDLDGLKAAERDLVYEKFRKGDASGGGNGTKYAETNNLNDFRTVANGGKRPGPGEKDEFWD